MIEPDIDQDPGIAPIGRLETRPQGADFGMVVGVGIDGSMLGDAALHGQRQPRIHAAADEIAKQAAKPPAVVGTGQQGMGKVIHRHGRRGTGFTVSCAP